MLDQICVALDGSEQAATVVPLAYAIARRAGARVTLLHVTAPAVEEPVGNDEAIAFDLLGATDDRRWWTRLRGLALTAPPGLEVRAEVVIGDAAIEVPAAAGRIGADLVVAGAPARHGPLRGLLVGSGVGRRLLRCSPCPILLLERPPPAGDGTAVLALGRGRPGRVQQPVDPRDVDAVLSALRATQPGASATAARPGAAARRPSWVAMRPHPSLLARIFAVNAFVLIVATLLLIVTPARVSSNVVLNEVLVVLGGLSVMLVADYLLLRRTLAPLRSMAELMRTIDPLAPGRRIPTDGDRAAEVAALSEAFNGMLDRLETERRQSARRALAAQEDERVRIARELHDEVGQTLTAITIQAERAAEMEGEIDRELVGQIARTALHGVEDVRRIARELRPEALDDLGLVNALIALTTRVAAQSGVRVERSLGQGEPELPTLPPEVELVVYRVAQEALTNAVRHAAPSTVQIKLDAVPGGAQLVVRDDGSGITPEAAVGDTAGVTGMRERAMLVGGQLELHAPAGGGTHVKLWVPAP